MSDLEVAGVRLGVAKAGIKYPDRDDLTVIELAEGSAVVGVFTQNAFCAAPVQVARKHLNQHSSRLWVVNTGNANAGTGPEGVSAAIQTCQAAADVAGVSPTAVLPFSTGVIGEPLPTDRMVHALPEAFNDLRASGWARAAGAILTTDTRPKLTSREVFVDDERVTIVGAAKGAGMIRPDMATMLAFLATDAALSETDLNTVFRRAIARSFNRVTVDGDTSTNDAAVMAATGKGGARLEGVGALAVFEEALTDLCIELAQGLVRDGEGASKFVSINVMSAQSGEEADRVAYTIAHSPLVKTALFASDPNWGRLLAAIGRAGLVDLVVEDVTIEINGVLIAEQGARAATYTEEQGAAAMASDEISIDVHLKRGTAASTVWTTDLSYDYVRINAEYRT